MKKKQTAHCATDGDEVDRPGLGGLGDLEAEYQAIAVGPALVDRSDRGLLEITGADRAAWLHNLTTNQIKTLSPGEGNYAFVLNLQGRILFDLNVLVQTDSIWVDLDRRFLDLARKHFDKYAIMEDVKVTDRSDAFVRFGLVGEQTKHFLSAWGAPQAAAMPWFGMTSCQIGDHTLTVLRHDFCGPYGVELFVPSSVAAEVRQMLCDASQPHVARPVGNEAVQVHRIEAGIPWPFHEITDEYLPAETKQLERAVSFNKGCYLGQEVVERMRSRGAMARLLVGLRFAGDTPPPQRAALTNDDGKPVGHVTSVGRSIAQRGVIGLGYVKTASSPVDTTLCASWDGGSTGAVVAVLPFTSEPIR